MRLAVMLLAAVLATPQPDRQMWLNIKRELSGPRGEAYFESAIRNAELPPLTGTVISSLLNDAVSRLELGIEEPGTADATLVVHHLGHRIKGPLKQGARIRFSGVAASFTKEPLVVSFDVGMRKIEGIEFEPVKANAFN